MDIHLKEFAEFCKVYIDDIIVASVSFKEHLLHLDLLFNTLSRLNITLEPAKSYIRYLSIQLLSLHVDALGMTTLEERIKAITSIEFLITLADIEHYLSLTGSLQYYIHNYAAKAAPLKDRKVLLLKQSPVKGQAQHDFVQRTILNQSIPAEEESFKTLQHEFTQPLFLAHFSQDHQLYTELDTSKENSHGAIVYHTKGNFLHSKPATPLSQNIIEPILFLSH